MKKSIIIIFALMLTMVLQTSSHAKDKYTFGVLMGKSQQDQQLEPIFKDVFKYIESDQKVDVDLRWYQKDDEDKFLAAAKAGELDFAYAKEHDPFIKLVEEYGYEPVMTLTAFKLKKVRVCFYTKKDKNVSTLEDMKGLSLLTYYTKDGYFPLRQMLKGEKPEDFFGALLPNYSGQVSLRRLINGEADLAFSYDANLELLKMGNPAVAKDLKELSCTQPEYNPGIVVRSREDVPSEFIDGLIKTLGNAHKSDILKRYRPLLKQTYIKFIPVDLEGYESLLDMYRDAKKKGWDKDYEKWFKTLSKEEHLPK